MSEELKPCRRCGLYVSSDGIKVAQTDTGTYTARFECPDCGEVAETCMRHSSEDFAVADVIDDWNSRWVDPALLARIAELKAERDRFREALEKIAQWDMLARSQKGLIAIIEVLKDTARETLEGTGE